MPKKGIYKIVFVQMGEVYEMYAKAIYQSDMYGFIEIEDYLFDQNSQIVVDPTEEKLKSEFKGVNRSSFHFGTKYLYTNFSKIMEYGFFSNSFKMSKINRR